MSLIVAGGTGAIGRCVVHEALQRSEITRVVALTRSSSLSNPASLFGFTVVDNDSDHEMTNTKSRTIVTRQQLERLQPVTFDWELFCRFWEEYRAGGATDGSQYVSESFESKTAYYKNLFGGHTYVSMSLGTTRHDAGSATAFRRCDYDYVVNFAEALHTFSASSLIAYAQVSAQFASENSWFLYPKTKGSADAKVMALGFPRLSIYRPGVLERGDKTRFGEKIAKIFLRAMPVKTCGRAIVRDFVHCGDRADGARVECAGKKKKSQQLSDGVQDTAEVFFFSNADIEKEASAL